MTGMNLSVFFLSLKCIIFVYMRFLTKILIRTELTMYQTEPSIECNFNNLNI